MNGVVFSFHEEIRSINVYDIMLIGEKKYNKIGPSLKRTEEKYKHKYVCMHVGNI